MVVAAAAGLKSEVTASLLTASPGAEIYELDGHTGLRLADPDRGLDVVINWGVFDFDAPNFIWRYVKGHTDYLCVATDTRYFMKRYLAGGRTITEQHLSLSRSQGEALYEMVLMNLLPQNRVYRYSYIYDNCATRPLEMIERAVGRQLIASEESGMTFRDEMTVNHRLYPWYQFGIDLALGSELDRSVTVRQLAFSPMQLCRMLSADSIVCATEVHQAQTRLVHTPTPWPLRPLAVTLAVMLLTAVATARDLRRRRISRWVDSVEFTLFGIAGCLIAFLVFVSSHSATSPNWLLVWLNPLCLLAAILPWIKSAKKWLNCYHFANFAVLIVWLLLWPLTNQHMNDAFWPLIVSDLMRSGANIYICRKN